MKKRCLRPIAILLALLALVAFSGAYTGAAFAELELPEPSEEFYVADFAGIFDDDYRETMISSSQFFDTYFDAPLVVTSVNSFGNSTVEAYAQELYQKWMPTDTGILIVVSPKQNVCYTEIGPGLRTYIPESYLSHIQSTYAVPFCSEGEYAQAALRLYCAGYLALLHCFSPDDYSETVTDWVDMGIFDADDVEELERAGSYGDSVPVETSGGLPSSWILSVIFILILGSAVIILSKNAKKDADDSSAQKDDMPFAPPTEIRPYADPQAALQPHVPSGRTEFQQGASPAPKAPVFTAAPLSSAAEKTADSPESGHGVGSIAEQESTQTPANPSMEIPVPPETTDSALPSFDDYLGAFSSHQDAGSPWGSFSSFDTPDTSDPNKSSGEQSS